MEIQAKKKLKKKKIIFKIKSIYSDLYIDKIYSYYYFEKTMCSHKIMTPWKYNNNNLFLPITPIILPENIIDNNYFNKYEINGLLVGKCISHICSKNLQDKLLRNSMV